MDQKINELKRQAKQGDLEAAYEWLRLANRLNDRWEGFLALKTIADLTIENEYPELKEFQKIKKDLDKLCDG